MYQRNYSANMASNTSIALPSGTPIDAVNGSAQIPKLSLSILLVLFIIFTQSRRFRANNPSMKSDIQSTAQGVPWKYGFPLLSDLDFFNDNEKFLQRGFEALGDIFAFRFIKHKVIAIGPNAETRKIFLQSKDLNMLKGWNAIRGQDAVNLRKANVDINRWVIKEDMAPFTKRAAVLFRKERLEHYLPIMFEDTVRYVKNWAELGRFNPWEELYTVVMHLLLHLSAFEEITSSQKTVRHLSILFQELEETHSFGSAFFPRITYFLSSLPGFQLLTGGKNKVKRKIEIVKEFVGHLKPIIKKRTGNKEDGALSQKPHINDQMQLLIDQGDSPLMLIQFLLAALFIGLFNQFRTTCWLTAYVLSSPKYKALVKEEIQSVLDQSTALPTDPIATRLSHVPLEIWEMHTPILDTCIRETIRLTLHGVAARKNVGDKIIIFPGRNGQAEVAPGDFTALSVLLVHMDENIYPEPTKWDPSRYERHEDKEQYSYLGWGGGRHYCAGKRVAELQMKIIVSSLLLLYPDCSIEFEDGTPVQSTEQLPKQDKSTQEVSCKPLKPIYIRCS